MSSNQQALLMAGGGSSAPPVASCIADPYYDSPEGDPYWANVVLSVVGDSFNDISSYARSGTANTGIAIDSVIQQFGANTLKQTAFYGGRLTFATSTDFSKQQVYTIEFFIRRPNTTPLVDGNVMGVAATAGVGKFVALTTANQVTFTGFGNDVIVTPAIPAETWTHFAICRDSSNTQRVFVNGTQFASSANSDTNATSVGWAIFGVFDRADLSSFIGNLANIRWTQGICRYTGNFVVPTAAFPDVYGADTGHTILSLHGESIVDSSSEPKTLTNSGVTISGTQEKFGASSMYFDGSSRLNVAVTQDFYFDSNDYTIEGWIYPTAVGSVNRHFFSITENNVTSFATLNLAVLPGGNLYAGIRIATSGSIISCQSSASAIVANNWYYVMFCRVGSNAYLFLDGVLVASSAAWVDFPTAKTLHIAVGAYANGFTTSPESPFQGYIDDLRITKGVARYTADFTPPALTFCDSETASYVGQIDGTERLFSQQLTTSQGTLTIANPWVKLSGNQLTASPGSVSPTLPNKTAALTGTSATVSAGTVLTSNKTVALIGASVGISQGSLSMPPYPDFTRVLVPSGYGITVSMAAGTDALVRLNLNADGTITTQVAIGTLVSETARPAVWIYNSFPSGYVIADVANAYKLNEFGPIDTRISGGIVTNTIAMNNGVDMSAGGYWEIEYSSLTSKPATFTKIIITGALPNNPRYGEVDYYGIFYFTFRITL
jgi:Concanavalin A-like lectin/glucanases superfamily